MAQTIHKSITNNNAQSLCSALSSAKRIEYALKKRLHAKTLEAESIIARKKQEMLREQEQNKRQLTLQNSLELEKWRQKELEALQQAIPPIILSLTREYLTKEVTDGSRVISERLKQMLDQHTSTFTTTVICHPDSIRHIETCFEELKISKPALAHIRVNTDPSLHLSDLVLETVHGQIRSTLEDYLAAIAGRLKRPQEILPQARDTHFQELS